MISEAELVKMVTLAEGLKAYRHDDVVQVGHVVLTLVAEVRRLQKVEAALKVLCDRVDEITKHSSYNAVFTSAWVHGVNYMGPTTKEPMEIARAALAEPPGAGGTRHD